MIIQVVGFDPAFTNWGTAWDTINTETLEIKILKLHLTTTSPEKKAKVRKSSDRLLRAQILSNHLKEACVKQQVIFSEIPTGSQSAVAAMGLGIAVGVLSSAPIPVIQVTPNDTKMCAVGKRTASKNEMINWAYEKYPDVNWITKRRKGVLQLTNANEHLADAIAVIYAGIQSDQFKQLLQVLKFSHLPEPSASIFKKPKISL